MKPEEALQVLQNVMITRVGLTRQDLQVVEQAWQRLETVIQNELELRAELAKIEENKVDDG